MEQAIRIWALNDRYFSCSLNACLLRVFWSTRVAWKPIQINSMSQKSCVSPIVNLDRLLNALKGRYKGFLRRNGTHPISLCLLPSNPPLFWRFKLFSWHAHWNLVQKWGNCNAFCAWTSKVDRMNGIISCQVQCFFRAHASNDFTFMFDVLQSHKQPTWKIKWNRQK